MSDALLNFLVEIAFHIITLIILAYIPLVTLIIFRTVRLRRLKNMTDKLLDLCFDTLRGFFFCFLFYFLYTDFILLLFRIVQLDLFVATLASQPLELEFVCHFVDNNASDSLPTLESEYNSTSLNTYRNVIAPENEASIYDRIRILESQHFYNIPPQNQPHEYENLVRQHFDQALDVDHYLQILDQEYQEVQLLEKKALLQDRLHEIMIHEPNIHRIRELSPYTNIRKEAFHFIQTQVEPVSNLEFPFQRNLMEGCLNSFIEDLHAHNRESSFYGDFYRHFTDEELRRSLGLPLP